MRSCSCQDADTRGAASLDEVGQNKAGPGAVGQVTAGQDVADPGAAGLDAVGQDVAG